MENYTTQVTINCSIQEAFTAISKNLEDWWGKQDFPIDRTGLIFKVSWGEPWYQFKVLEYQENREMIWECIDANQKIDGLENVEKEWVGTKIHWTLSEIKKGKTLLEFEHQGLVPDFICFEFCAKSWNHFLKESLVNYLENN
ncbi:MAG: hypothetical protein RIB79_07115 [Allomuricauda sp.]